MPTVVVTGPTVTQNSPFLPYSGDRSHHHYSLRLPTMARMSWLGGSVEYQDGISISVLTKLLNHRVIVPHSCTRLILSDLTFYANYTLSTELYAETQIIGPTYTVS